MIFGGGGGSDDEGGEERWNGRDFGEEHIVVLGDLVGLGEEARGRR